MVHAEARRKSRTISASPREKISRRGAEGAEKKRGLPIAVEWRAARAYISVMVTLPITELTDRARDIFRVVVDSY
ncbi:hypothetical protein Q0P33_14365, partial [Staphylococcus aureus]|nr:hypothetical protein [Staphylococcus aureus]